VSGSAEQQPVLQVNGLSVTASGRPILRSVGFSVRQGEVFGIIGPSGAGKSTLLRAINRLVELTPALQVTGDVLLRGESVYRSPDVDEVRARIGMLFQQPVVFPKSIAENVIFGARHLGKSPRQERARLVEKSLRSASLWEEVKDRLRSPALTLSMGQQQRLCLARLLAVNPDVILMDEPTSALDPKSTGAIEDLIVQLKEHHTMVLVTHNVSQARRITDWVACLCVRDGAGEIVESACCDAVLDNPQCREVIEFLSRESSISAS